MTEILRLSGVCKAFGGIVVADDVNLSIAAGEILGLIGPNGAGKTSLFNLISGVVRPDAGRIMLQGEPIDLEAVSPRARRNRTHLAEHAAVHLDERDGESADRASALSW